MSPIRIMTQGWRRYFLNIRGRFAIASVLACGFVTGTLQSSGANSPAKVDFNRDVRPILSDNCYACHGPDSEKRKAGLRLDVKEGALAKLKSDAVAVVPGHPEQSALVERITTRNEDDLMPPPDTGKHLSEKQVELLKRWIAEGAEWKPHWSFIKPESPALPAVKNKKWPRNPIDSFILARLEQEKLRPSKEADKFTLIRRVTFDLTGLPPTPDEVEAFVADRSPDAYERLVDRLLQSPRYGEHEARYWLDVARYGDTHGLHLDNERSMWPYRDWVVGAFNRNLPFDQFTVEQLAGDLLPAPTREQKVASGFNRCNVSTSEGGAIDEEFYVRYAVDRTETMATAWLGLTVGCAACHDHKYDPISQKEFYQLYAFFNNMNEAAMDGNALLPPPVLKLPTPEQQAKLDSFDQQISALEKRVRDEVAKIDYQEPDIKPASTPTNAEPQDFVWVEDEFPRGAKLQADGAALNWIEGERVFSGKRALARTDAGRAQDVFTGALQPLIVSTQDTFFVYVYLEPTNAPKAIMLQLHTKEWSHRANWGDENAIGWGENGKPSKLLMGDLPRTGEWVRLEVSAAKFELPEGSKIDGLAFTQFGGTVYWDKAGLRTATSQIDQALESLALWEEQEKGLEKSDVPQKVRDAIKVNVTERKPKQAKLIRDYYLENIYAPARIIFDPLHKELANLRKEREEFDKKIPATMISQEKAEPRAAYLLKRGQYDQRGEPVARAVPAVLPPLKATTTTNRLDLARWLVNPEHPLTSRVTVNRFWQQFFGTGLVKTSGDFGATGEWPSHPELLDWLAIDFMQNGWDVKRLIRQIVTSATYRQSSAVTPALVQKDPQNRLLARGPRFRLDGEMIRDNALYVSGLLVEKMGGRGVRPYQPPGIWEAVGYTTSDTAKFTQDHGDALYRRSLYTFWKRTAAPPYLTTFDAPSREKYCTRRERTDTPLQALVTMNDPQYVEAARHLGARMIDYNSDQTKRLEFGFRLLMARLPSPFEKSVLNDTLNKYLAQYQQDREAARKLIAVGESPVNEKLNASELAAYTMVGSLLLNLDETLNKN
ncbi:MAG TPA: PSD1 and planctomycete cytochrome C domain-containing protein [Verrucomicrobiae bacterium]|nr:PSD1 and planctomycete cytochrome C domain-containing protein [Verrucomicrobiae bacterium]